MRRQVGQLLRGRMMTDSKGKPYPPMVRANRVSLYCCADDGNYNPATQISREGFWLVLDESVPCARYQVLHTDWLGKQHLAWMNVGDIEEEDCFEHL